VYNQQASSLHDDFISIIQVAILARRIKIIKTRERTKMNDG
jgi:hypothetical protein